MRIRWHRAEVISPQAGRARPLGQVRRPAQLPWSGKPARQERRGRGPPHGEPLRHPVMSPCRQHVTVPHAWGSDGEDRDRFLDHLPAAPALPRGAQRQGEAMQLQGGQRVLARPAGWGKPACPAWRRPSLPLQACPFGEHGLRRESCCGGGSAPGRGTPRPSSASAGVVCLLCHASGRGGRSPALLGRQQLLLPVQMDAHLTQSRHRRESQQIAQRLTGGKLAVGHAPPAGRFPLALRGRRGPRAAHAPRAERRAEAGAGTRPRGPGGRPASGTQRRGSGSGPTRQASAPATRGRGEQ